MKNRDKIEAYLEHAVAQDLLDSYGGFVSMDSFSAWVAYDKATREEVAEPRPVKKEVLYYDEDGYVITL